MNFFKHKIFIFFFLVLQLQKIYCTHFTITAHEKDCFHFKAETNNFIVGSYEIIDTNSSCIITILNRQDKNNDYLFKSRNSQDKFEIQAKTTGMHSFCYENKGNSDITIMFTLRVKEVHGTNESDLSTVDDVQKINDEAYELYEQFLEVYDEQERMMEKADLYKQFNEKINSKLILWSEIQIILLIILTLIHIYYIKSFFEIKTIV
ncbi:cop-coated vesicle membrane protein p24 precursor, putative [Plasmodium gallinaceum]|uniref:Cop-coated vesicle membrane protein p24, putative n=1 Tax=Plasmodium gallinaceum TaxID=5849 RepID=A0A1J1GYZ8_PLAGA|nr:cop-coated vesicle membrane protein p24 precursor, putative [Plasmodium gallinaceum]CRG97535.1 cop-coated vesicle membrane protein p24 precursor, putative [Plasmodium gallinaceum]